MEAAAPQEALHHGGPDLRDGGETLVKNIKQLMHVDAGQHRRQRHAAHCGRNFGTNEATTNNNKPSSSSPLSAARESSRPALFFAFPAGPHVAALASWLRPDKAALGSSIAAAPRGVCPVTDASQARPAAPSSRPFWIPGEVQLAKGWVLYSLLGLEG